MGDDLLAAGKHREALTEYLAAQSLEPHDAASAHYRLARAYHSLNEKKTRAATCCRHWRSRLASRMPWLSCSRSIDDRIATDAHTASPAPSATPPAEVVVQFHATMTAIREALGRIVVGQEGIIEQLLISVLIGGHCLITGLPGTAKTLMVRTLARALGLDFKRIQFTPDLMPTDVTGTDILDEDPGSGSRRWRFEAGPIFTQILLADEINRTPPKTQSALLEAMQELRVTARGKTYELDGPFVVLATQNPIELEGTYPLPEAQLDRFVFNVLLDYLDVNEEVAVVERNVLGIVDEEVAARTDAKAILDYQRLVREVPVSDDVTRYAVNLVRATRPGAENATDLVDKYLRYGASVRAAIYLCLGARARALLAGRYHVTARDIQALAPPVLRHRLQANYLAESDGVPVEKIIGDLTRRIPEPGTKAFDSEDAARGGTPEETTAA